MAGTAKIQVSILTSARDISIFQNIHAGSVAHIASCSMDTWYSLLPSGEVKDRWSHTSISPICLHCIDRDLSTSTFYPRKVKKRYSNPITGRGSQISRQSTHEGSKVVSPMHQPPLPPQEIFLVLISVRG